jgi:hypothetical protein
MAGASSEGVPANLTGTWMGEETREVAAVRAAAGHHFFWSASRPTIDIVHAPWLVRQEARSADGTAKARTLLIDAEMHESTAADGSRVDVACSLPALSDDEAATAAGLGIARPALLRVETRGNKGERMQETYSLVSRNSLEVTLVFTDGSRRVEGKWALKRVETEAERRAIDKHLRSASAHAHAHASNAAGGEAHGSSSSSPLEPETPSWETPDFTGAWGVDKSVSDEMEPVLVLMGLPWLVRKVANGLDVTTVIAHRIESKEVDTLERASVGILNTNNMIGDGVEVEKAGSDGRLARVTCPLFAPEVEDAAKGALGCMRIVTVLPDNMGTTDNLWILEDEGRKMRQVLTFTRDGKKAVVKRLLVNKEWKPQPMKKAQQPPRQQDQADGGAVPLSKIAAPAPDAGREGEMDGASTSKSEALAAASHPLPMSPRPASESSVTAADLDTDPFFVSLSGAWAVDRMRSQSLDPVWRTMGVNMFSRLVVGSVDITSAISHSRVLLVMEDSSALGTHKAVLPLDGQWRPVKQADSRWMLVRASHVHGSGDKGPAWLGHEAGSIPAALLRSGPRRSRSSLGKGSFAVVGSGSSPSSPLGSFSAASSSSSSSSSSSIAALTHSRGQDTSVAAHIPYYSSLPFEPSRYCTSTVTVETLLVDVKDAVRAIRAAHAPGQRGKGKGLASSTSTSSSGSSSGAGSGNAGRSSPLPPPPSSGSASESSATHLPGYGPDGGGAHATSSSPRLTPVRLSPAVSAAVAAGLPLWQAMPWPHPLPRGPRLLVTHRLESREVMTQQYTHFGGSGDTVVSSVERFLVRHEGPPEREANMRAERRRVAHARAIVLSRRAEADKLRKEFLLAEEAAERERAARAAKGADDAAAGVGIGAGAGEGGGGRPPQLPPISIAADPWAAVGDAGGGDDEDTHGEYDVSNGCSVM